MSGKNIEIHTYPYCIAYIFHELLEASQCRHFIISFQLHEVLECPEASMKIVFLHTHSAVHGERQEPALGKLAETTQCSEQVSRGPFSSPTRWPPRHAGVMAARLAESAVGCSALVCAPLLTQKVTQCSFIWWGWGDKEGMQRRDSLLALPSSPAKPATGSSES